MVVLSFFEARAGAPEFAQAAASPVSLASRAGAIVVKRAVIVVAFAEINRAGLGVNFAMASLAHWSDAVKSIGAIFCSDEQIIGMREAEEMAWLVFGQFFVTPFKDVAEIFFQKSTTEAIAVKIHFGEISGGVSPQVFPAAALEDAVESLIIA